VKRTLLALVPILVLAAVLAACGGDDSGGSGGSVAPGSSAVSSDVDAGKQVARDRGCTSCHSSNGDKGTGPTWKGLYGSEVELADGTTVTADETYVKESVTDPGAKIVKGYGNVMPHFTLSQEEVNQLFAYIQSLA
jgi:cytochrome c oxidase subunit II